MGEHKSKFWGRKGGFSQEKNLNLHNVAQALAILFFGRDNKIETSSNSGVSPGETFVGPAHPPEQTSVLVKGRTTISNQQLDCTPQAESTTEESLRFARALEALGKHISGHTVTKDNVFAK